MVKIFPSILSADFANLKEDLLKIINEVDGFHIDVMDGVFVPNISFGFPVLKALRSSGINNYFDTHLMIIEPEKYIEQFAEFSQGITIHYEASNHIDRALNQIKLAGCDSGISLNPHTPVNVLENVIYCTDRVLLMSVNPGFGGQKFIENTYRKIDQLKELAYKNNKEIEIQIDGGVSLDNIKKLKEKGANSFVAGSAIFNQVDRISYIKNMKEV